MLAAARDQNLPEEVVKATETDLLNTLNLEDGPNNANAPGNALLVIDPEGKIAGMAISFSTYIAWSAKRGAMLEDFYVLPEYRGKGYAKALLQELSKRVKASGCDRVEWICYKDNLRAMKFYGNLGAKERDDLAFWRLDQEGLEHLIDS